MKFLKGTLRVGNFTKTRIEALSDGVFAIVMTLLVIEIRIPHDEHGALLPALQKLYPQILSYILSFVYIAIYWANHHLLFHIIKSVNRGLFWFNSLFLMTLAFIPFPTSVIGRFSHEPAAVVFYGLSMLATALSFVLLKWYVVNYAKIVDPSLPKSVFKESILVIVIGPSLYGLAILLAFVNTNLAILIYMIIPVIYFLPTQLEKKGL